MAAGGLLDGSTGAAAGILGGSGSGGTSVGAGGTAAGGLLDGSTGAAAGILGGSGSGGATVGAGGTAAGGLLDGSTGAAAGVFGGSGNGGATVGAGGTAAGGLLDGSTGAAAGVFGGSGSGGATVGAGGMGSGGTQACQADTPPAEFLETMEITYAEMIGEFDGRTGARPPWFGVIEHDNFIWDGCRSRRWRANRALGQRRQRFLLASGLPCSRHLACWGFPDNSSRCWSLSRALSHDLPHPRRDSQA